MNPSSGGESIPTPKFEVAPQADGPEEQHDKKMEQTGQSESGAGKQQPAALNNATLPVPVDIPAAAPIAIPGDDTTAKPVQDTNLQEAHDSHKIEAQWVNRAKKVIAQTKDDPHTQKQKMSEVKAEYIRKRFNKTIPSDGAPQS